MLSTAEIKTLIDNDRSSTMKRYAAQGQRYYDAEHDILKYRIFFVNADGKLEEDKLKSNSRISHPFFTELVDQEVQYMLSGKSAFIKSDDPDLQKELDAAFNDNEDFVAELYEVITGCVAKGFEYAYAFNGDDGRVRFQCADSLGVVEVRAKDTDDGCDYVIYHYIDRIAKETKVIRRIQVWDDKQTTFFCQENDGEIMLDTSVAINPRPHTLYQDGGGKMYFEGFGFIPFFRLDNNRKRVSGLKPIKSLIDDYDMLNNGLTNNIQDTNEAMYVVKGFQGDNMDELLYNLKAKKAVGVDVEGGIDIQTVTIPVEARRTKLEIDENNIYRFGMGINTHDLKDSSATTNIAIKAAYTLLDLKTNKLEIYLKQFLRKLLKVFLSRLNHDQGTDYGQRDIYFDFERSVPTNALENTQIELTEAQKRQTEIGTILNIASVIDDDTRLQLIAEQLDIDYNELRDKIPKDTSVEGLYSAQNALSAIMGGEGDEA